VIAVLAAVALTAQPATVPAVSSRPKPKPLPKQIALKGPKPKLKLRTIPNGTGPSRGPGS
jgi:hypothetical protein